MPVITLPDGSQRHFDHAVSPMDVALDIGPGLAKACIAGRVNGELVDASDIIENDAQLAIITAFIIMKNTSTCAAVRTCRICASAITSN